VARLLGKRSSTDGVNGTISILPQKGKPSENNSALQTFSKDYELFMLTEHNLQRLQSIPKVKNTG
jgi:hypothetical protein